MTLRSSRPVAALVRRALWTSVGVGIALFLAVGTLRTGQSAEEPATVVSGKGRGRTDQFTLRGGYYHVWRRLTLGDADECYLYGRIDRPNGSPHLEFGGPNALRGQSVELRTDWHYFEGGAYVANMQSACGEWQISISRQLVFDTNEADER